MEHQYLTVMPATAH